MAHINFEIQDDKYIILKQKLLQDKKHMKNLMNEMVDDYINPGNEV